MSVMVPSVARCEVTYTMNQLRVGLKIMQDGDPCIIVDTDFVKPGKGQAFVRLKFKNLKTQRVNERTLKSNETVEGADVTEQRRAESDDC